MEIIKHGTTIDFIGKRRPALFISTILNVAILVGIAVAGFNFGVDFQGGTGVKEVRALGAVEGGGEDYQVVASGMAERIAAGLAQGQTSPDFEIRRVDYVGPQVGKQLRNKGIMALVYAMVAILIYVAFR